MTKYVRKKCAHNAGHKATNDSVPLVAAAYCSESFQSVVSGEEQLIVEQLRS